MVIGEKRGNKRSKIGKHGLAEGSTGRK